MKTVAFFFAAFALVSAGPTPTSPAPLARLPARADGLVTAIGGSIEGTPLWFDLDTGATATVVDSAVAKKLALPLRGTGTLRGAGSGSVAAKRLGAFTIRVGSVSFRPRNALALDLSNVGSSIRQGGILGFDFYRRYVVELDYDAGLVTLYDPHTYVYRGRGTVIPLVIRPPRAFVSVLVSAQGVRRQRHLLRLDTGSSDAVDDDIVLRSSAPKKTIVGGVGIGKRFTTYLGTVSALGFGPFTLRNLPSATGGVQLIGDAVWQRFNVVFDFSRSKMYLTPRSAGLGSTSR